MDVEMRGLEFKIGVAGDDAAKGIEALRTSLSKLKAATKGGLGLTSAIKQMESMRDAVGKMNPKAINGLAKAVRVLGETKVSASIANQINRIAEALNSITTDSVERLQEVVKGLRSMKDIGGKDPIRIRVEGGRSQKGDSPDGETPIIHDGTVEQLRNASIEGRKLRSVFASLKGAIAEVGAVVGINYVLKKVGDGCRSAASGVKTLIQNIPTMYAEFKKSGGLLGVFGQTIRSVFRGGVSGVTSLASSLKGRLVPATSKSVGKLGQLFSSLKRIAMYRAIRYALSAITKAFKEGINNLYRYSSLMGGTFAQSMNSMATNALYLKNSLGAMSAPIVNALAPAIDYVTGKIVNLLNLINMLIARLMGNSTFTAAKKVATQYGQALDSAAGSAKKLKDYTHGLDELNIFKPDEGGGGGGGSLNLDYGSMFEEVAIDTKVSDFVDRLKAAFDSSDWNTLGATLGEKFNEIVASIDYEQIGSTVGNGLDGVFQTAFYFLDTLNFDAVGSNIATLINTALANVDTTFIGRTIVSWFTKKFDFMIGLITNLDWGLLANKVADGVKGALSQMTEWLNSYDWSAMGSELWSKLKGMISGIDWSGLAQTMFTMLGTAVRSCIQLLGNFLGSIGTDLKNWWDAEIQGANWQETGSNLMNAIGKGIGNVTTWVYNNIISPFGKALLGEDTWADVEAAGKRLWEGLVAWFEAFAADPLGYLKRTIVDPLVNGLKNLFGIHSPSTVMQTIGGYISQGLLNGIKSPFTRIGVWVQTNITQPLRMALGKTKLAEFTVGVKNEASKWWANVKSWWDNVVGDLLTTLKISLPTISIRWETANVFGQIFDYPAGFNVTWNAKGGILDGAQIFGMLGGNLLGGGEAGREALLPLDTHTDWMDTLADKVRNGLPAEGGYSEFRRALVDFYEDCVQPTMAQMASDMNRQANKREQTNIQIGNRLVTDAVKTQQSANGYQFAK